MLGVGWLVYGYFGMVTSTLPPLLTKVEADLELSSTQSGLLLGAWPLLFVAFALQAGRLNDRLGLRRSIMIGISIMTLSAFLRGMANSFEFMFFAVAVFGIGGSIISTGMPKLIAQWFEGGGRTRASGIYITGPAMGMAFALAASNSLILPNVGNSWHNVFFVYGAFGIVAFAIWLLFGRDGPTLAEGQSPPPPVPMSRLFRMWPMWIVVFVGLASFTMGHGFRNWLPAILESKGFTDSEAGLISSMTGLIGIPGALTITAMASRLPSRKMLVIAMLVVNGATLTMVLFSGGSVLIGALLVQGFFAGAMIPLLMSLLMDLPGLGAGAVGTASGIFFTVGQTGGFGAPVLVGVLKGAFDSFSPGIIFLASVAFVAILPAMLLREGGRPSATSAKAAKAEA